ncbi:transcriptional activator RinB [Staphylococcus caprae]|uniref:transcriptional activator RinB n=1 Tax=Staphylococcus caprae TaxID=29380 RepID=UPI000CCFFE7F|nr:transcriptional regulator [Staphylococcus caprae]POA05609.1 transcriptional regulator [Staphylococcus caprae]SUL95991.1 regulator RinB [Staphylococcus caprae]
MIKRILKNWFTIAMYELGKYITNQIIIKLQSEDDIDTFNQTDHAHLNMEVSK